MARVDWALLSVPRANELSGAGRFPAAEWARIYWNDAGEILVRRTGTFAPLVADYEYRIVQPGFDPFAPLPTNLADADRLVTEMIRNRADNPASFATAAWLCLNGDEETACAAARAIAAARPELRRAALRLERRRVADAD